MALRRRFLLIELVVLIISIAFVGIIGMRIYQISRISLAEKRDPLKQPYTKWESECGDIVFYVDENSHALGTMKADKDIVDFCIVPMGSYSEHSIALLNVSALDDNIIQDTDKYEICNVSYKSKKTFVITIERGTYFEEGRKFTIHRVAENVLPSE